MPIRHRNPHLRFIRPSDTQLNRKSASSSHSQSDDISAKSRTRASLARRASAVSASFAFCSAWRRNCRPMTAEQHSEAESSAEAAQRDDQRLLPPLREHHRLHHRDVDDQWPGAELVHRYHRGLRSEKARRAVGAALPGDEPIPGRRRRHPLSNLVGGVGIPDQHKPIAAQQSDGFAGGQFDRPVKVGHKPQVDQPYRKTEEGVIRTIDPASNVDGRRAGHTAIQRRADERPRISRT